MTVSVSRPSFEGWDSRSYARSRPTYPAELFDTIAAACERRELAWDCAAGSGQASRSLAERFARVVATDLKTRQLIAAGAQTPFPRVAADAQAAPFPDRVFDLVTVAQALHWFATRQFFAEVHRVAGGGVLATWSYGLFRSTAHIDAIVDHFYEHEVGPFWPPERAAIETEYAEIEVPFARIDRTRRGMARDWSADEIADYIATWSAVRRYRDARRTDPIPELRQRLREAAQGELCRIEWTIPLDLYRIV